MKALMLLFISLLPTLAMASDRAVFLERLGDLPFAPQDAFFFYQVDGGVLQRVRAAMLPPGADEKRRNESGDWLIGAKIVVPVDTEAVTYSTLVLGTEQRYQFFPPQELGLDSESPAALSDQQIFDQLDKKRAMLQSWQVEAATQESTLKRLRADAEIIADIGRIVEVKEEADYLASSTKALSGDIAMLKGLLQNTKISVAPNNFAKRENELTQQVAELASLVRSAESEETTRRAMAEGDLQEQLASLQMGGSADLEQLEALYERITQRLQALKRERGLLREQSGVLPD